MAMQYVKHSRSLTQEEITKYGNLATHDIHVPILLAYELGKIPDKNGVPVDVDKDFINSTMGITNNRIQAIKDSPFARLKSIWKKPIEQIEAIPIIKNHKTDEVDDVIGHTQGLLYTEEVEGVLALLVMGIIKDPEAKKKIEGDLFRNTSLGTRKDGSIKEVSFVINEAIPHGGLVMSEETNQNVAPAPEKTTAELQFAEQVSGLQFEENQYETVIIPNHLILSKLIRSGKILPSKYEKLINTTNYEALELMECTLPSCDLGLMFGTSRDVQPVELSELRNANNKIDKIVSEWNEKSGNTPNAKSPPAVEVIKQNPEDYSLTRQKELKYILELAEYSPEIVAKYIKCELGEEVEDSKYKDTLLSEYLNDLTNIKTKLKQLQLGENNHG